MGDARPKASPIAVVSCADLYGLGRKRSAADRDRSLALGEWQTSSRKPDRSGDTTRDQMRASRRGHATVGKRPQATDDA